MQKCICRWHSNVIDADISKVCHYEETETCTINRTMRAQSGDHQAKEFHLCLAHTRYHYFLVVMFEKSEEQIMAYCPICGRNHDPDLLCMEQADHALRRAGIEKKSEMSSLELRQLSRKAGRSSIILFLRIAGVSCLVVLFFVILHWFVSKWIRTTWV